jgi:hypothetical protein
MEDLYTRNKDCDIDITKKFGRPLWDEASLTSEDDEGTRILITPMETPGLWRLDKIKEKKNG